MGRRTSGPDCPRACPGINWRSDRFEFWHEPLHLHQALRCRVRELSGDRSPLARRRGPLVLPGRARSPHARRRELGCGLRLLPRLCCRHRRAGGVAVDRTCEPGQGSAPRRTLWARRLLRLRPHESRHTRRVSCTHGGGGPGLGHGPVRQHQRHHLLGLDADYSITVPIGLDLTEASPTPPPLRRCARRGGRRPEPGDSRSWRRAP